MEDGDKLKEDVLRCGRTGQARDRVLAELAERAYRFARGRRGASEDEPGEFLLFMYPRLERLIDRYRDAGVPFDHYLNSVLAWNLRSYRRRARCVELRWQAARLTELWPEAGGGAGGEDAAEGGALPFVPTLRGRADRKRFLLLVLRSCWRLDDARLERAAKMARVSAAWLAAIAGKLRGALAPRLRRLERLRARRDAAYARMRLLQERRAFAADPQERQRLDRQVAREAAGWRRSCRLIGRVPLEPTHRRIAAELGMPRGTVDTCLRAALRGDSGLPWPDSIRYA